MRELSESNRTAKHVLDLTGCPDDSGDTDSEDNQSTIVFRTTRPFTMTREEERERSALTTPVLTVKRSSKDDIFDMESTGASCHSSSMS